MPPSLALALTIFLIVSWLAFRSRWSSGLRSRIQTVIKDFHLLQERDEYLCRSLLKEWRQSANAASANLGLSEWLYWVISPNAHRLRSLLKNAKQIIRQRNQAYAQQELSNHQQWFDQIESHPLTQKQRESIVYDENNCLVVAGAGTGKTSTVVAKAGYALMRGHAASSQILLLAYSKKAQEEMATRIEKRLESSLEVRTFHSLGMEIIAQTTGKRPSLSPMSEDEKLFLSTIQQYINDLLKDEKTREIVANYFAFYLYPYRPKKEFRTENEHIAYLRAHDVRTLKGEQVKSFEELLIANWLLLHGIDYKYEADYVKDTATVQHRQYAPDFYLPKHDIYIEHFGVDREGHTASFVNEEQYRQGIAWKRDVHFKNGTRLIETYSYEKAEGLLFENLEKRLSKLKVPLRIPSEEEISKLVATKDNITRLASLIGTFLRLFKSNQFAPEEIRSRANSIDGKERANAFCDIFFEIFTQYEQELKRSKKIDFEDMIRTATECALSGQYAPPFKYFIVDEFQDISRGRAKLLKAIIDRIPHRRLFCVGDDWQSIYRFTGSDVAIMGSFEEVFGYKRETHLDKTFRFDTQLLKFSSAFILKNPSQIKKKLTPYSGKEGDSLRVAWESLESGEDKSALSEVLKNISDHSSEKKPASFCSAATTSTDPRT